MFDFVRGSLVRSSPECAILDVNGMGYKILTPSTLFAKFPDTGNEVLLYTSFVVRENMQALYGFLDSQERDFFEVLLGISGVGPKMALAIVGHLGLEGLQNAITEHNLTAICKVPGVGKKTAERLLLEMRDKLNQNFADFAVALPSSNKRDTVVRDAMSALVNLGYNQLAARKALQTLVKDEGEVPELGVLITKALQHI